MVLVGVIVGVALWQRRKVLRNTLGAWLSARGHPGGFDLQRRAEEVSVEEFLALARSVMPAPTAACRPSTVPT